VDRIGKGIRGAPRDALIADITPAELRGAAFGLRQSLDTVGAVIGPLLAVALLLWLADDVRKVMWVAALPAFLAVALLFVAVREPERNDDKSAPRVTWRDAGQLSSRYWFVVILGATFTLARFSEAFLILRAQNIGLDIAYVPIIMIVMNVVYALLAYPLGEAADRMPAKPLLVTGLLVLIIADIVLGLATSPWMTFVGAAFWGLHMAFTQGLLSKLIADTAPATLRGTAFGVFNLISGIALLFASVIAGALWTKFGASATFYAGAGFAAIAAMGLLMYRYEVR
jgi:MFS family permease